jgi:hypothetical protein
VGFGRNQAGHAPVLMKGAAMETSLTSNSLGVHISENLKRCNHTYIVMKKARQGLFNLRMLKKYGAYSRVASRPGKATPLPRTARLFRGGYVEPNAPLGAHCLLYRTPIIPGQEDPQGPQPPKPCPVLPASITHSTGASKTGH